MLPGFGNVLPRSRKNDPDLGKHLEEFSENDSSFEDDFRRSKTSRAKTKNALPEHGNVLLGSRNVVDQSRKSISRNTSKKR